MDPQAGRRLRLHFPLIFPPDACRCFSHPPSRHSFFLEWTSSTLPHFLLSLGSLFYCCRGSFVWVMSPSRLIDFFYFFFPFSAAAFSFRSSFFLSHSPSRLNNKFCLRGLLFFLLPFLIVFSHPFLPEYS